RRFRTNKLHQSALLLIIGLFADSMSITTSADITCIVQVSFVHLYTRYIRKCDTFGGVDPLKCCGPYKNEEQTQPKAAIILYALLITRKGMLAARGIPQLSGYSPLSPPSRWWIASPFMKQPKHSNPSFDPRFL
ncbi:hypothetical protein NEUTE2DRAFT_75334, partial [Neurospora tetrasperma FGSC 2509]